MPRLDPPVSPAAVVSPRAAGVILLLVASVLWSLSGLAIKVAAIHPLAFTFWRSLAAAGAMAAILPLSAGRWPAPRWMALTAAFYTVNVGLLVTATSLGTAARAILLQYTGPVFVALFAWLLQGRRIGGRTLAAMLVAAAGIAVMIAGAPGGGGWVAPLCGLISGVAFGALVLALEKVNRRDGEDVNPIAIVCFNNLGTAALLLPACLALGILGAAPARLAIACATGVVQLAAPYLLFQLALRRVRPVDASLLILLEPVLNPIWVALAVGEHPDWSTLIGGAAILAAMVIEATKPAAQILQASKLDQGPKKNRL